MNVSLGRIVLYVETEPDQKLQIKAAIVSRVYEENVVDLHVFESGWSVAHSGPPFVPVKWVGLVPYDPDNKAGSWHWPPRV